MRLIRHNVVLPDQMSVKVYLRHISVVVRDDDPIIDDQGRRFGGMPGTRFQRTFPSRFR